MNEVGKVKCDKCGREVPKGKTITDKGVECPELIKKAKDEGRDHLTVCNQYASENEDKSFNEALPNIRKIF